MKPDNPDSLRSLITELKAQGSLTMAALQSKAKKPEGDTATLMTSEGSVTFLENQSHFSGVSRMTSKSGKPMSVRSLKSHLSVRSGQINNTNNNNAMGIHFIYL